MTDDSERWLTVGKVVAAHGLQGWLRIRSFSDFPERFLEPGQRWLQRPEQEPVPRQLKRGQFQPGKNLYLVQFDDIGDRATAEAWVGATVLVPADDRPALEEDEYRVSDLIGLTVIEQTSGRCLGRVTAIVPAGNDLLEITLDGTIVLIPFVKALVPVVDLAAGKLEVTPLKGLLPDVAASMPSSQQER